MVGTERGTAVPRAATNLTRATAATERQRSRSAAATLEKLIFIKVPHDLFKFTSADENVPDSPFQGG